MNRLLVTGLVIALNFPVSAFAKQFKALLFTKTDGWHHSSVIEGVNAIKRLSDKHFFDLEWQEDANYFNDEYLTSFDVVIFLQTTGNVLDEQQQAAFKRFIEAGKGFVGIHSAADTEKNWDWYKGLVGHTFVIHPAIQTARVVVQEQGFPGLAFTPKSFLWTDEYYHYSEPHSKHLKYILTVDESSYEPAAHWGDIKVEGMGEFHPIAWYQHYHGGRSFYTGLGHTHASYQDDFFQQHIFGGIYWAATGKGFDTKK